VTQIWATAFPAGLERARSGRANRPDRRREVVRAQIERLIVLSAMPGMFLQVVPFSAGRTPRWACRSRSSHFPAGPTPTPLRGIRDRLWIADAAEISA
jgi:hypothetical protein